MKIEVEVTEEEMKNAIARHVRAAIADRVNSWGMSERVKRMVNEAWDEVAQSLISEELRNSTKLKQQINDALVAKIRRQLNSVLKGDKK